MTSPSRGVFSVVLYEPGLDRLYESTAFLAAARARGCAALLFLRGPALKGFVSRRWPLPKDAPESRFRFGAQTPDALLSELRSAGGVRVYACSAWVGMLNLTNADVAARVDAVVGLNAFLSQAQGGPILNF